VIDMLRNEKYMGDVLLQKTYTDSNYNRHSNTGEKDQYYYKDNHEAIISREDFAKAQDLIDERAKMKCKGVKKNVYLNRYALSGKIVCGECGRNFRRKTNYSVGRSYIAWSCIGHIEDKESCSMLFLRDGEIKATFTTMMSKLAFSHKLILEALFKSVSQIDEESDRERMDAIDKRMEQLMEERNTLITLMAKGFLEPVLFNQERNVLDSEMKNLSTEKTNLVSNSTSGVLRANDIKDLIDYVSAENFKGDYTEELFEEFVENIIVNSRDELTFNLKCGLSLKEKVVR
jgi:site-specific DNA recombinase